MLNVLSVDLEEYFHPTEVQGSSGPSQWAALPSRVEQQTETILELLRAHGVSATFFVLGWVAHAHPRLIRKICREGHEIGCHSYSHQLIYNMTPEQFRNDTLNALQVIEDACGVTPRAYRAPSYSITARSFWALDILAECGFTCDSSIYPIAHDRYGIPGFPRHAHEIRTKAGSIFEVPIATVELPGSQVAPVGGGGYLRLLPYCYTSAGIRRVNQQERQPACIYLHPWEMDPNHPRIAHGFVSRIRTYTGLKSMAGKVNRLLSEFRFGSLREVYSLMAAPNLRPLAASAGQ